MNDQQLEDPTGTIAIHVENGSVESLRISSQWRNRFEPAALAEQLSQLIGEALPPRVSPRTDAVEETPHRELPIDAVASYLEDMRRGRQAMRRYLARLKAGEVERRREERHEDAGNRVNVSTVGGRFNAVYLNPEWAQEASLQELCDTILALLPRPLAAAPQVDTDIAEARGHFAAARQHFIAS